MGNDGRARVSLDAALTLHQQGNLAEAERLYRRELSANPQHEHALHLLGLVALQTQRWHDAAELIERSLRINPGQATAFLNLGLAQRRLGKSQAALDSFDHALRLAPDLTDALVNRGRVLIDLGRPAEALQSYVRALSIDARNAAAWNGQGLTLRELKRFDAALDAFDQALIREPRSVTALFNRGNILLELHRAEEALESFRRILQYDPADVDALINSGIALLKLKRPAAALETLDLALRHRPESALALMHRGIALTDLGHYREALQNYDRGPLRGDEHPEVCYRRAVACISLLEVERALAECRKALVVRPDYADALFLAGVAANRLDRTSEAIQCFDRLLEMNPDHPYARGTRFDVQARTCDWSNAAHERQLIVDGALRGAAVDSPFPFLAISGSAAAQLACARSFVADKYPSCAAPPFGRRRAQARIHVAYVSRDLRNHAVSRLMAGVFEQHDRSRFEITAISLHPEDLSPFARRVRAAFDRYLDMSSRGDAEICAALRAMEVDIAVDLTGFTEGARTQIFAGRAAPVQVNYLGFPATMGAPYMDYLLADRFVVPPHRQMDYAENIVYLPHCFQANDDRREFPGSFPSRTELGLPRDGFVWCCLNAGAKINASVFDVWMRLLDRTPGSVLWLRAGPGELAGNLRREAAKRDVDPDRIVFAPGVPYEKNIARLRAADIFLDTAPFTAGASASDALWAGVPLLTLAGDAFAARMAGSLLQTIGLPELITEDLHSYERRALELAHSPDRLEALRRRLGEKRRQTPLFDTPRFCRHLESAYTHMAERSRRGEPPAPFAVEPG